MTEEVMLPEEWDIKTLGDVATITSGGTPSKANDAYWGGDVPWVRTTEVQNCYIYEHDIQTYISFEGLKNSSAKLVPDNTILLAMIGQGKTRGQVALLKLRATTNQNCAAIILHDEQHPEFYFNYLLSQYENIRNLSNSAGQSNLSGSLVKSIKVPVPPLPEQEKIAQVLSAWDKAIINIEQLLVKSEQQKQALMQKLLTGNVRLPGCYGAWRKTRVADICEIGRGRVISRQEIEANTGNYPVYSSQTLNNGIMGYINTFDFEGCCVTWTTDGLNAGTVFYRTGKFSCTNVCGTLFARSNDLDLKFLAFALSRITHKHVSHTLANPKLMNSVMGAIVFSLPALAEQQKIASVLCSADREINTLQQKLAGLKREKKALMQQLLTGKRRLRIVSASHSAQY